MAYQKRNFKKDQLLTADDLNAMDDQIASNEESAKKANDDIKNKLDKSAVVKEKGDSETAVMSQAAATVEFDKLSEEIEELDDAIYYTENVKPSYKVGNIANNGSGNSLSTAIRVSGSAIHFPYGGKILNPDKLSIRVFWYSSSVISATYFVKKGEWDSSAVLNINAGDYIAFAVQSSAISEYTENSLSIAENITAVIYTNTIKKDVENLERAKRRIKAEDLEVLYKQIIRSNNIVPSNGVTDGVLIDSDGTEKEATNYRTSDYFVITERNFYTLDSSYGGLAFYTIDKEFIETLTVSNFGSVQAPTGAYYARYFTNSPLFGVYKGVEINRDEYHVPYIKSVVPTPTMSPGLLNIRACDTSAWYKSNIEDHGVDGFGENTTYSEVIAKFDSLMENAQNGYITKTTIGTGSGTDLNGNTYPIYKYDFIPKHTNDSLLQKRVVPKILIDGSIHGFEKSSTYAIYYLMKDIIENWDKSDVLATFRNHVAFSIIPISNPWGFDNNSRLNANGVNLNRNFPVEAWESGTDSDYGGQAPLDQPEAQAIDSWLKATNDMLIYLNCHTNGYHNANGYPEMNANIVLSDLDDEYYNRLFSVINRHVIEQTARWSKDYPDAIHPDFNTLCGRGQYGSKTETSGSLARYVPTKLNKMCVTLEGFNGLVVDEVKVLQKFTDMALRINTENIGNFIAQLLCEYAETYR